MAQRLFQDTAGSMPAILAGQPVGLIRRLAGSVDAVQATALNKPVLARWPRSGKRNLADGAQSPATALLWRPNLTTVGITCDKVGSGIEDGQPYVDYRLYGTSTAVAFIGLLNSPLNVVASEVSAVVTGRVLSGALVDTGQSGLRIQGQRKTSAGDLIEAAPTSAMIQDLQDSTLSYGANQGTSGGVIMSLVVQLRLSQGVSVDQVWRIKGMMYAKGPSLGAFQYNYGMNDVVETGVADLWHLYNDGNDALHVTLPAGSYAMASIDVNRAVTITTITSDGSTPINTLRHERQLDVVLRAGAFTASEEVAIRDYWARIFA